MMLNPRAHRLAAAVNFDIARLFHTSVLFRNLHPLGSESLIALEIQKQAEARKDGSLLDTNLVIYGRGTVVTLTQPAPANPTPAPSRPPRR